MAIKSYRNLTKVVSVSGVEMYGKLSNGYPEGHDYSQWFVGDTPLEDWLAKFEGRDIDLTISVREHDETDLVPEPTEANDG